MKKFISKKSQRIMYMLSSQSSFLSKYLGKCTPRPENIGSTESSESCLTSNRGGLSWERSRLRPRTLEWAWWGEWLATWAPEAGLRWRKSRSRNLWKLGTLGNLAAVEEAGLDQSWGESLLEKWRDGGESLAAAYTATHQGGLRNILGDDGGDLNGEKEKG